ncbi:MAG TPA: ATP-binding protein [Candidatus Acidoferrum sp.]|jgi:signal transduction histidine kinase/ActR/RegA family two-component response regulator|nr:ATP-binding protein [Candidatus Acidoferrum sp.]
MPIWGKKKQEDRGPEKGVARAAAEGASREELVWEALRRLSLETSADRFGVWIEPQPAQREENSFPLSFRGAIWEKGVEATPAEWARLSPEFPLPQELFSGKSVELDLDKPPARPMLGPLVEMRVAVWAPVARSGRLLGVLLACARTKQRALPRALLESVAAELLLAVELEEEQRIARERQTDLAMAAEVITALGKTAPESLVLTSLVKQCTETSSHNCGLDTVFAVVGRRIVVHGKETDTVEMAFPWKSGDPSWTRAIENGPLAAVWKKALETRRLVGSETQSSWPKGEVGRVLALPLEFDGEMLGVLVAGLRPSGASLGTLARLELRASLAAAALAREKRRAADERREAWQRSLLDSGRETVLLNERGEIAGLSRGARELLKKSSESGTEKQNAGEPTAGEAESSGRNFAELFHPREREGIKRWTRRAVASASSGLAQGGEPGEFELRNGTRVRLPQAMPAGEELFAVLLDPVQASASCASQERVEDELSSVLEWLEEGVVLFDAKEEIRAMNSRFAQMAGLLPAETAEITSLDGLIRRLAEQAAEPERFAEHWRELARDLEGGVSEELQLLRPSPRVLERAARPVLDGAGHRLGRVEIYRDLTARRVFQSKLLQTEKLAALGQMVTGVAHELSNPLTSILGYAQRLLVRSDAAGRTEEARKIYQEAERASTILRQLLLNARETQPERRWVSLNQVVLKTMELQRFGLATEKIRLKLELDPTPPFVHGDAGQLQQVLMNLVGNARQAIVESGKGGNIQARTKWTSEGRVLLEVSDDGPGIPPGIMARIFDPFFTTKPAGAGTGLGLAIALGIVREHGGQLKVSSPPAGGAIFTLELPVVTEIRSASSGPREAGEKRASGTRAPRAAEPPYELRHPGKAGPSVLVVEDEPTVARLIADVLEDEGMRVEVLMDGRAALERAEREHYDLVICDMKMPGLDGQNFYKMLARSGNPLRGRFLFVTGDLISAHTQKFLERYHLPYVAKPFRVEELSEKVKQVLAGKIPRETMAAAPPAAGTKKSAARHG